VSRHTAADAAVAAAAAAAAAAAGVPAAVAVGAVTAAAAFLLGTLLCMACSLWCSCWWRVLPHAAASHFAPRKQEQPSACCAACLLCAVSHICPIVVWGSTCSAHLLSVFGMPLLCQAWDLLACQVAALWAVVCSHCSWVVFPAFVS
jgi:hypothetical protein